MQLSGIYAITDDILLPEPTRLEAVAAALGAGISLLQFRSKSGTRASRLKAAIELLVLCRAHHVPLIINDDVDLCLAADADGVHLGQRDAALESARTRLGPAAIIGVTCHSSVDSAVQAQLAGADYVAFGRFFDSATKPEAPPAQLAILGQAKAVLSIPIVAIGGINAENGADVLAAGADMLAVIDAIFGDDQQVRQRTGALVRISKQSQRSKPGL
ncbi:MAG TPA: thiamine phosphate synthase [Gammaproteobacteria bacterium]|nr:thiamine phosphate synthase [Gammaproteobacteria bacterium]